MDLSELSLQIKTDCFKENLGIFLSDEFSLKLGEMDSAEIKILLNQVFGETVNSSGEFGHEIFELYYSSAWFNLFNKLSLPSKLSIYEIAAGDGISIPKALDAYAGKQGKYVTVNLNKELSSNFINKTKGMDANIRVIEDNGINAGNYFENDVFDVVALHHAINDIIQTIISDIEGINTVGTNWWETEPQMLRAVFNYHKAGKLKAAAYNEFIKIIDVCNYSLKKGSYMIFDNCTFNGDYENLGYSKEFHSSYIAMAREWINEAKLGLEEININGYDKKWWMILKKV